MKRVLAVAGKTWKEAFHNRAALFIVAVFVGLVPLLPFVLKGDGTQKGLVQIIITYTFLLANFLICVLTCLLATSTVCGEIERKEIHITDTKPVRRWEFLAGKWLGVVSLDAALLLAIGGVTYGVIRYSAREIPGREQEHRMVYREVLVCRRTMLAPPLIPAEEIRRAARKEYEELRTEGRLPRNMPEKDILDKLEKKYAKWSRSIPPDAAATWEIKGLRPARRKSDSIFIRYRHESSRSGAGGGKDIIRGAWLVGGRDRKTTYSYSADATADTFHEFWVPADAVWPDGTLQISFLHFTPALAIFPEDGLQVLQGDTPFLLNYLSGLFVILCEAAFLAALGTACGSFLSFPVAGLVMFFALIMAFTGHNIADIIDTAVLIEPAAQPGGGDYLSNKAFRVFLRIVVTVSPKFGAYYPVEHLVSGRLIPPSLLLGAAGLLAGLQGGLIALAGCAIYHRRELARVIA